MAYDYVCNFDLEECLKTLGLNERGRVQRFVTNEVIRLSDPYVPMDEGTLKNSVHIANDTDVVWSTPYAHYQWGGMVWEDPKLKAAGFPITDESGAVQGFRSRKGVVKVPTDRELQYNHGLQDGGRRGPRWVERMLQDGGLKAIEDGAREMVRR